MEIQWGALNLKIYTKKGDKGETAIFYGLNINKHSLRVDCLGSLDELNANLGMARTLIKNDKVKTIIKEVQNDLFHIGAELAMIKQVGKLNTKKIELAIDSLQEKLPLLKNFILPSGCRSSSYLHISRTICRRAERKISKLYQSEEVSETTLQYLNRLSDLLFVLARFENHEKGIKEELWRG